MKHPHKIRFPRLRAALALTGVFALSNASAQSIPTCILEEESFGEYYLQTALYLPVRPSINVQYITTLRRPMPQGNDSFYLVDGVAGQRAAMGAAEMVFDFIFYYGIDPKDSETKLVDFSVRYPNSSHSRYDSQLTFTKLYLGSEEASPQVQNTSAEPGLTRATFYDDVAFGALDRWNAGRTVLLDFYREQNGQRVFVGDVILEPGGIGDFHSVLSEQKNVLVEAANEGRCRPRTHLDTDCFLTTATVHCIGLADNCWELETLRGFRDNFLLQNSEGRALVSEYYDIAPAIVEAVNRRSDSQWQWLKTYWTGILPTALLVKAGMHTTAQRLYQRMVRDLQSMVA